MNQTKSFVVEGKDIWHVDWRNPSIAWSKASRQWYLKFDKITRTFGFTENVVDNCIYVNFNGSRFTTLVLYVDDISLAYSDKDMLHETKKNCLPIFIWNISAKPYMFLA
jgi:hypothetical protein